MRISYKQNGARFSTYRAGGIIDVLYEPTSIADFLFLSRSLGRELKERLISGGSNVLISDKGLSTLVLVKGFRGIKEASEHFICLCGTPICDIITLAKQQELGGLEFLSGVPATIGGATVMNAGAFGCEIGSLVEELRILTEGKIVCLKNKEGLFEYRKCNLPEDAILLEVTLKMKRKARNLTEEKQKEFLKVRRAKQPQLPSLGSVFKNIEGLPPTGFLLDSWGLKGMRIGDAAFSEKHANIIVNLGKGTAEDYLQLVSFAEKTAQKQGIKLIREIKEFTDERKGNTPTG